MTTDSPAPLVADRERLVAALRAAIYDDAEAVDPDERRTLPAEVADELLATVVQSAAEYESKVAAAVLALAAEWDKRADHFDARPADPNWYARRVIYEQHAERLRAAVTAALPGETP